MCLEQVTQKYRNRNSHPLHFWTCTCHLAMPYRIPYSTVPYYILTMQSKENTTNQKSGKPVLHISRYATGTGKQRVILHSTACNGYCYTTCSIAFHFEPFPSFLFFPFNENFPKIKKILKTPQKLFWTISEVFQRFPKFSEHTSDAWRIPRYPIRKHWYVLYSTIPYYWYHTIP